VVHQGEKHYDLYLTLFLARPVFLILFILFQDKLMTFSEGKDDLTDKIDFIVCLGGDGTLLYASSLFQQSVPPIMAFHLGSLGFLTPFEVDNFEQQITHVLEGEIQTHLECARG
jgi:NAD kinase